MLGLKLNHVSKRGHRCEENGILWTVKYLVMSMRGGQTDRLRWPWQYHCVKKGSLWKLNTWWRHQWKHFPRYWPFVREIHRSPVNPPPKGQWRGALVFSLICAWIKRVNKQSWAGDLRRHRAHYHDVIVVMVRLISASLRARWIGKNVTSN